MAEAARAAGLRALCAKVDQLLVGGGGARNPFLMESLAMALPQAQAQQQKEKAPVQVLIKNVNLFDGTTDKLRKGINVLVEGNLIKKISA